MKLNTRTHKTNITLPEVFELANKSENKDHKMQILKSFSHLRHVKWLVNTMYNRDFSKMFVPRYKPNQYPPDLCGNIWTQVPRIIAAFNAFDRGDHDKYDRQLTLALETLSADEAALICKMIEGKKVEGISKKMWKDIYPEFFRTAETSDEDSTQPTSAEG
jgi:hypothetical protein